MGQSPLAGAVACCWAQPDWARNPAINVPPNIIISQVGRSTVLLRLNQERQPPEEASVLSLKFCK